MRVLVVDDSMTMRLILKRWLSEANYEVVEARNGIEALSIVQRESFDLLTLDVDMPGMDGYEVCSQLRTMETANKRVHLPVIFVTSHDTLTDRKRGFEVGATDFISKPPQQEEFLARVDRLLRPEQKLCGLTALVVEDSSVTRKIVAYNLRQNGIQVLEAANGEEAYQLLQRPETRVDILITDYDMPVMDGKELCRRVRTELGMVWLPILFLSGMSETNAILELFAVGATDYIIKPFTKEELTARISVHVEIRKLNDERVKRIQELERLNRLKDSLLAVASHDLRAPLNGIIGHAHIILMDEGLPKELKESIEGIRDSGDWLLSMISDLLDVAKSEAELHDVQFVPLDLAEIVESCTGTMVHMATPKGITLRNEIDFKHGNALISGDRNSLLRVCNNLLSNAIKFTPVGGSVDVSISRPDSRRVCLSVKDTGIGIPPAQLPELFKPFTKVSREGTAGEKSTGLGMSIVKEIVERHFGTIEVSSTPGQGTEFLLVFPAID